MGGGRKSSKLSSTVTSAIEGVSLGEMEMTWRNLTASEMRIKMMDRLQRYKVGYNDVENFNLGLIYNSKTLNCDNYTEKDDKGVVEIAMKFKKMDEIRNRKNLVREKLRMRKKIEKDLGKNTNQSTKLLKHLREVSETKKRELKEKYDRKISHLRKKYETDREKEMDRVPTEMEGFESLAVFDKDKFEEILVEEIEVVKYGEVELDEDEKAALRLHPKMALPRRLNEGYMNLPLDIAYTKLRWQLKKDEEMEGEDEKNLDTNGGKKKKEDEEVEAARTRQVYDAERRVYDERKQRVTDLQECSRSFLPKPL